MPIMNKGQRSGILYMENNLAANAFTRERVEILGIVATQAAISLENARLFELAITDGLTKLFTHRYFQHLLDQEIDRSRRYGHSFSLVMMDIDNFKAFNDAHGHPMGDEALRQLARVLRTKVRSVDIAARYGGEEFILMLPETELRQALIVCENIRKWVEQTPIPRQEGEVFITISVGVAVFPQHALEKMALIQSADKALYDSKRNGKNLISVAA
jgi:diguanylate cyclase (GGDEF)-like protein